MLKRLTILGIEESAVWPSHRVDKLRVLHKFGFYFTLSVAHIVVLLRS